MDKFKDSREQYIYDNLDKLSYKERQIFKIITRENFSELDIETVCMTDYSNFDEVLIELMYEWSDLNLKGHGVPCSDKDDEFPNNTYHYGYLLDNLEFYISYTGVAGHYWGNRICYEVKSKDRSLTETFKDAFKATQYSPDFICELIMKEE